MSLATFQDTLRALLMTPEGKQALDSPQTLQTFLAEQPLTPAEREALATQPRHRLGQYDYMLLGNFDDTLQALYPLTHHLLADQWEDVVSRYFWAHPPQSYRLIGLGEAFPDFLAQHLEGVHAHPALPDLARYEWVEAELLSAPDVALPADWTPVIPQTVTELETMVPVLNGVATLLRLDYAIPALVDHLNTHRKAPLPEALQSPQAKLIWVFRTPPPYTCRYFAVNSLLAAWLVNTLALMDTPDRPTYRQGMTALIEALAHHDPTVSSEAFGEQFLGILKALADHHILLGSERLSEKFFTDSH